MSARIPPAVSTAFPVTLDSGIAALANRDHIKKLNFRGALWLAIMPLALLAASSSVYAAVMVSSSCRATIVHYDGGYITTQEGCSNSFDATPLTGTVSGSAEVTLPSQTSITSDVAYADYSARGDYGNLGVAASSWAAHPSTSPYRVEDSSQASVTVTANDTILVTSSQLAQGTLVTLSLAGHIEGTVSGSILKDATNQYTNTSAFVAGYVEIRPSSGGIFVFDPCFGINGPGQCIATNGGFSQSYSDTLVARVGSTLAFRSYMTAYSDSRADNLVSGYEGQNLEGQSSASAMNSLTTYLTPTTAGVQLIAQSGHDYTAPVPEPATWGLMLSGGLALVGVAVKRRSRNESKAPGPN